MKPNKRVKFLLFGGLILFFVFHFIIHQIIKSGRLETIAFDINQDLLGYWNFEQPSKFEIRDSSGHSNHGYLNGQAPWGVLGQIGYTYILDNDYITMGDKFDFDANDSFTVSAWVRLDKSIGNYRAILGKASPSSLDGYILRHETNGNLTMRLEESDGYDESNAIARDDYRDDKWHHVVGVIDRDKQTNTIYVDGFKMGQASTAQIENLENTYHFNLASLANGNVFFKGLLDEVRIYSRPLSLTEVRQLYNQECQCTGLPLEIKVYPAGSLLRAKNDYKVYYINRKSQKKWIINESVFNLYHNKWSDVLEVEPITLSQYPDVYLIRGRNDYRVYFIEGNTKKWIRTLAEFENKGYRWEDVDVVKDEELWEYVNR